MCAVRNFIYEGSLPENVSDEAMPQSPPADSGIYFPAFLVAHSGCYGTPAVVDVTWVLADPEGTMSKRLVGVWGR